MKFEDQREVMVKEQLISRGIHEPAIIKAIRKVPRHHFVPEDLRRFSYNDCPLRIGHKQTISQPYIVAIMMQLISPNEDDLVLEIGTGSGYQTALLAEVVKNVYTVERVPELMDRARFVLDGLGYDNIYYRVGDGTKGWEKAYPPIKEFDKIIVSAAAPSPPKSLLKQLKNGGKLVIPTGNKMGQELKLITKQNDESTEKSFGLCTFVPLIGSEGWDA